MYKLKLVRATEFLELSDRYISREFSENVSSYIRTNLIEFSKLADEKGKLGQFHHKVVYATEEKERIVGFRYYLHLPESSLCHLFATYVDYSYRRKGIAKSMILHSFEEARECGCVEFEIRLTQPTGEKDGLFQFYQNYAVANSTECKFTIYYWSKLERYGYA